MKDKSAGFFGKIGNFIKKAAIAVGSFFCKLWELIKEGWRSVLQIFRPNAQEASPGVQPPSSSNSEATILFDTAQLKESDNSGANHDRPSFSKDQLEGNRQNSGSIFKPRDKRPAFVLGTFLTIIRMSAIALVILVAAAIGAVFGVANAYLGTTPELDLEEISDNALTSFIYDCNGELITTYAGVENREYASLDEIPKQLQEAVIAVEDVRFYHHNGVDLKRLLGAFVGNLTTNKVAGGSTITQQLIKNQLLSSERSYKRKIQEASLALQLEKVYTKDQILEAYLNTIPLGGTNYGVKAAAKDYFGKELDELSLKECACLAGITQYPWAYSPRRVYYGSGNRKLFDARIETVLKRMYTAGYITLDEMNEALAEELVVIEKSTTDKMYDMPHFVEYAVYDVVTHFLKDRGLEDNTQNRNAIENELRTKGYKIYTTVDPEIQNTVQETITNYDNYPKMRSSQDSVVENPNGDGSVTEVIQPQVASVVLDHETGQIKALVGGRNEPTTKKSLNRAYQSRMPVGSSIKPLAVYGPAFEKGAGLGTIIANIPARIDGWNTRDGYPLTSQGKPYSPTTIRRGIKSSLNIVAARVLVDIVGVEDSYQTLLQLGVSEKALNKDGIGLALGTSGITTLEMAGAYGCIANGGTYLEPLSFTKVEDSEGNVILDADEVRETREVFQPSTCWMLVDAMKTAVANGTATRARIKDMTVAGKTGTTEENRGVFFAGVTPYYTSTIWIGHDNYKKLQKGAEGGKFAAPLWQKYMSQILEGYDNRDILPGSASDYGVVKYTVCGVSGMKATSACSADPKYGLVTDYFAKGTAPTETCNMHVSTSICTESGMVAGPYCPAELIKSGGGIVIPEGSPYAKLDLGALQAILPNVITNVNPDDITGEHTGTCNIHTEEWALAQAEIDAAKAAAQTAITNARNFISAEQNRLTQTQVNQINQAIAAVEAAMNAEVPTAEHITARATALDNLRTTIAGALPDIDPSPSPSPSPSPTPSPNPSDGSE